MLEVVCAVIYNSENNVFAAQRSATMPLPLKWEFPGGKIEPGETATASLVREIAEELGVEIEVGRALEPLIHEYPGLSIRLQSFFCAIIKGDITLKEHSAFRWMKISELDTLDWAAADLPVVSEIMQSDIAGNRRNV